MNIKKHFILISISALCSIISGCTLGQTPNPTQTISFSTYAITASEEPILTETPSPSVIPATLDPLQSCFATPAAVFGVGLPNTKQVQEIIATVLKAAEIEIQAARTLDSSKFSTVFINDPRFPVPPETLETVQRLSHNPTLQSAGWLDYKIAYFNWTTERRIPILTQEALHPPEPTHTTLNDSEWCGTPYELIFESMNINTDTATVAIKDCGTYELTLVLVGRDWFIAAYKTLVSCYP